MLKITTLLFLSMLLFQAKGGDGYAASKSGVEGMVEVLATEFSKYNLRVNAIS